MQILDDSRLDEFLLFRFVFGSVRYGSSPLDFMPSPVAEFQLKKSKKLPIGTSLKVELIKVAQE